MTVANHVFLMEPQWNPMLEDQALDRVYRIGQTKEVTTTRYIVANTLEEVCQILSNSGWHHPSYSLQGIRFQQSKKRNLAEQAFALSRGHDNWLEVRRHIISVSLRLLIHIFRTSMQCSRAFPDVAAGCWDVRAPEAHP